MRTVQGWKDNRQNNVLFKDGSPPLFLKGEKRPKEAGLNTRRTRETCSAVLILSCRDYAKIEFPENQKF